jgi:FAD/FMN-containing dehydrogenase
MRGVRIDPAARRARVQAGTLWGQVTAAAAEHGLAGLAGSSPTVGVVGYPIGGGLGWLARWYGLAATSILAADVVTADGRLVRADREHKPDLLWAIRGGGGSFGIITALDIALYPVREVYGGALFWRPERAREILRAWRAWTDGLPDEVTSIARLRRMPARPGFPAADR